MKKIVSFSDGGARGNPGPAAIGVVLYDENENIVEQASEYIGEATNNQAEYKAVLEALKRAIGLSATHVTCFLDSELVVKQLTGKYKVKNAGIIPLFADVLRLTAKLEYVDFQHIRREKNKVADALVNKALDRELKSAPKK